MEGVKAIKRYSMWSYAVTRCSQVSPLCRILIQLQTDSVFNLSFYSHAGDWGNKNQYGVAGDLEAGELQGLDPARQL